MSEHRPTTSVHIDVFPDMEMSPEKVAANAWDQINAWVRSGYLPVVEVTMDDGSTHQVDLGAQRSTCVHCERPIVSSSEDGWVDPEATGDDVVWRETCDRHDTFVADHEPKVECGPVPSTWFGLGKWPTCRCGFAPRDNGALTEHWREQGFRVVDDHGHLVRHAIKEG